MSDHVGGTVGRAEGWTEGGAEGVDRVEKLMERVESWISRRS